MALEFHFITGKLRKTQCLRLRLCSNQTWYYHANEIAIGIPRMWRILQLYVAYLLCCRSHIAATRQFDVQCKDAVVLEIPYVQHIVPDRQHILRVLDVIRQRLAHVFEQFVIVQL